MFHNVSQIPIMADMLIVVSVAALWGAQHKKQHGIFTTMQ